MKALSYSTITGCILAIYSGATAEVLNLEHLIDSVTGVVVVEDDTVAQDPFDQNYVANAQVCTYTSAERNTKNNLPRGWTWQMPERRAIDLRTDEQRKLDAQQDVITQRVALYPPQSQFADAMYWASRGKPELLEKYYADVDLVKATVPKVI